MIGLVVREHRARVGLAIGVLRIEHKGCDIEDTKLIQSLFLVFTDCNVPHAFGLRDYLLEVGAYNNPGAFSIHLGNARIEWRRSKPAATISHGL